MDAENSIDDRGIKLADLLNSKGIKARYHKPSCRVYVNGHGKDISAYFEICPDGVDWDENEPLQSTRLKVWSNCEQGAKWKINRCKKVKYSIMLQCRDIGLIEKVCEKWEQVIL